MIALGESALQISRRWKAIRLPHGKRAFCSFNNCCKKEHKRTKDTKDKTQDEDGIYDLVTRLAKNTTPSYPLELIEIAKRSHVRFKNRYLLPSLKWNDAMEKATGHNPGKDNSLSLIKKTLYDGAVSVEPFSEHIDAKFGKPKDDLVISDFYEPLDLGDAVSTNKNLQQSTFYLVVEVPDRVDDPRYTIMSHTGELQFIDRSSIMFRIPKVVPKGSLRNLIHKVNNPVPGYGFLKTSVDGNIEAYAASPLAVMVLSRPLEKLGREYWEFATNYTSRLEGLHRILNIQSPLQISIFSLLELVKNLGKGEVSESFSNLDSGSELNLRDVKFGKGFCTLPSGKTYKISELLGVLYIIRKHTHLWSVPYATSSGFPLMITAIPSSYSSRVEHVLEECANAGLIESFCEFAHNWRKKPESEIPSCFSDILFFLKEYAVGNLRDRKSEAIACLVMKKLLPKDTAEVTKTDVYELLMELKYVDQRENPTHFYRDLALPNKGVSEKADYEQEYYELFLPDFQKDCSSTQRVDYTDHKVYCIDSETAHEIDDGISIERLNSKQAKLHIHIADPASYLTKDSIITKIAFDRGFTNYQPEFASAMLPQSLVNAAGLGINGLKTRALTFSIIFNFGPEEPDFGSVEVKASYVSKFPKYTYNDVDRVLGKIVKNGGKTCNDEEQDLKDLFTIAKALQKLRVSNGAILFDGSWNANARVISQTASSTEPDGSSQFEEVEFGLQRTTPSTILVSEIMVLANTISGEVLKRRGYSGIYKAMNSLPLEGSAGKIFKDLNKRIQESNTLPTIIDFVSCLKFTLPAFFVSLPQRHFMVGAESYAPSTSPLRRFSDIINHFQHHAILNGQPALFSDDEARYIALHLDAKNTIFRRAQKSADSYYLINYIKERYSAKGTKAVEQLMITSRPSDGSVRGVFVEFGLPAKMKIILKKPPPKVGDIHTKFKFVKLDSVGGEILLEEIE